MNSKTIYINRIIYTTPRDIMKEKLELAPLTETERSFVYDTINKMPVKQLADKYNKSPSRISHWKAEIYEHLFYFEMENFAKR